MKKGNDRREKEGDSSRIGFHRHFLKVGRIYLFIRKGSKFYCKWLFLIIVNKKI